MTEKPATEDYVPLAPWAGFVAMGIAAGHWLVRSGFRAIGPLAAAPAWLRWLGRHSLFVYMVHQPILLGRPVARRGALTLRSQPTTKPDARLLWIAYAVAALSFVTTLTLPYVGEEAIYTIAAMEMKVRGEYFVNTLYGTNHGQPPLLNWLIIPLADSFGWQHVLVASRLVAACATTATGPRTRLARDDAHPGRAPRRLRCARVSDERCPPLSRMARVHVPLFAFFAFAAMACLWIATVKRSLPLVWIAMTLLSCAV